MSKQTAQSEFNRNYKRLHFDHSEYKSRQSDLFDQIEEKKISDNFLKTLIDRARKRHDLRLKEILLLKKINFSDLEFSNETLSHHEYLSYKVELKEMIFLFKINKIKYLLIDLLNKENVNDSSKVRKILKNEMRNLKINYQLADKDLDPDTTDVETIFEKIYGEMRLEKLAINAKRITKTYYDMRNQNIIKGKIVFGFQQGANNTQQNFFNTLESTPLNISNSEEIKELLNGLGKIIESSNLLEEDKTDAFYNIEQATKELQKEKKSQRWNRVKQLFDKVLEHGSKVPAIIETVTSILDKFKDV